MYFKTVTSDPSALSTLPLEEVNRSVKKKTQASELKRKTFKYLAWIKKIW